MNRRLTYNPGPLLTMPSPHLGDSIELRVFKLSQLLAGAKFAPGGRERRLMSGWNTRLDNTSLIGPAIHCCRWTEDLIRREEIAGAIEAVDGKGRDVADALATLRNDLHAAPDEHLP